MKARDLGPGHKIWIDGLDWTISEVRPAPSGINFVAFRLLGGFMREMRFQCSDTHDLILITDPVAPEPPVRAADDFAAIARAMKEQGLESNVVRADVEVALCRRCEGEGWIPTYSQRPPCFEKCPVCFNPNGYSSP